jgi:hypothetical protein
MPTPATQPRHSRVRGFSYRLLILSDYNAQHYTAVDRIRVGRQRSAILFIRMSWRDNLRKLSHEQVREIVGLCSGAVLLIAVALVLSGSTTFLPQSFTTALQKDISSQSAALWWSLYPKYDSGWPAPHTYGGGTNVNLWGWCAYPYVNSCNTPLPSYADIYVTSNPAQAITGVVQQLGDQYLGKINGWQAFAFPLSGPAYNGSIPTVPAGTPLTIEWACQDFQALNYSYAGSSCNNYDAFGNCIGYFLTGGSGVSTYHDYAGAIGTNFNAGAGNAPLGSATVVPTQTTTYSVYCKSAGISIQAGNIYDIIPDSRTMSFTINVTAPPPTVTITGNGTNPTNNAIVGHPVTIVGTFTPGTGDALTETAINDFANNLWCGTGCTPNTSMWTASPLGSKSYTFTPVSAGPYIFYPAVQTTGYPAWNNYSQSLTVNVVNACQNGTGAAGSCTSCNAGYVLSGGNCAPTCPNGSGAAGSCTSCNAGYVLSGGNCVVSAPVSIVTFSANPTRVRKNTSTNVTFSWVVSNPPATNPSCTIFGLSGFTTINLTQAQVNAGSIPATINISAPSYFTLTCGSVTKQALESLIPIFQEI